MKLSHRSSGLAQPLRTVAFYCTREQLLGRGLTEENSLRFRYECETTLEKRIVSLSPMPLSNSNMTRFVDKNYANRKI